MLQRLDLRGSTGDLRSRLPRPEAAAEPPVAAVDEIVADVRAHGDEALRRLTARFDQVELDAIRLDDGELDAALAGLDPALRQALDVARDNIEAYHRHQLRDHPPYERNGVLVQELVRPVDRAGCYVPGGTAPLISTVLMTAVPAKVAGVPSVALCTPPGPGGVVAPGILAAARLAGVDEVYRVGGAQAVAAMAFGTETVRPVDVIVGPGNVYVSQAKRAVAAVGAVGVPSSFAGPSEVVVVADELAPVDFVAIDLIVQIEHGPDGLAWLITWSEDVADRVDEAVAKHTAVAARREIIEANLAANGWCALVDSPEQAIDVANAIAPEHLQLMVTEPAALLDRVRHAGAVFCGSYAPASVGDYVAGPNHVLPTYGSARFGGALRVDDFQKVVHAVTVDARTLEALAPAVEALATAEGLEAHAQSVRLRWAP